MLGLGIFTVAFLNNILLSQAAGKVQMTPSTYQNWGQVPGAYNANVTRNYTFFNFVNPFDVFYLNKTPIFTEVRGQYYQEHQNLLNPVYNPDNSDDTTVEFDFQLFTTPINAYPDDLITTVNLGSLGFWYSVPRLPDSQIASYGLATLIMSLELDIVTTLQSAAIKFECAKDFNTTVDNLFIPSGITDPTLQALIWNDPVNGLGSLGTVAQWVHAIANGPDSGSAKILGDYFYLDYAQMQGLFKVNGSFYKCVDSLNTTISNGYDCDSVPCDDNYFVLDQWSTQVITQHPAGGIIPAKDSVVYYNTTVSGYPEISYYFNNRFFVDYPDLDRSVYANVSFDVAKAARLLNYTASEGVAYCTDEDTLLHMGNLAYLYQLGQECDASNPLNLTILQPVVDRFGLDSTAEAHVLWKYVLYFQTEFAEQRSSGGTASEVILGMFTSTAIYNNFTTVLDNVPLDLTARIILNNITSSSINCSALFDSSSILIDQNHAVTICQSSYISAFDLDVIKNIYTVCLRPNGPEYFEFLEKVNITKPQLYTFCTTVAEGSFANFSQYSDNYLKNWYGCAQNYPGATRCSRNELAVLQWGGSVISQKVPEMLSFTPSLTLSDWYPELIPKPFEYLAVLAILNNSFVNDTTYTTPLPYNISNRLMTFDSLFNEVIVQTAMVAFKNGSLNWFEDSLFGVTPYHMVSYFRYIMMEIALGGFSQTRTASELLWGYPDPILTYIKNQSPYNSGDPSIPNNITLTGVNPIDPTAPQFHAEMCTGTNDSALTRQFVSINNLSIITFNNTYFNGNFSTYELISPWNGSIQLNGTDGVINLPGLETTDTVPIYISDANFQANLVYSGSDQDYSGLKAHRYVLSNTTLQNSSNNPDNQKWFSDVWDGLINISQVHKAPLFISKAHFLDTDPILQGAVSIYQDAAQTTLAAPSQSDNLYVDVEPYSGAAVGTLAALQINYEFKQDSLIGNSNYAMLPIMYTQRYMAFTSDMVSDIYGPLVTGLKLKNIGPKVFFPLAAVFLLLTIFCFVRRRMLGKKRVAFEGSYNRMLGAESRAQPLEGYLSSREQNQSSVENHV